MAASRSDSKEGGKKEQVEEEEAEEDADGGQAAMKVVVVGDGAVGKTSMLVSFIHNRFPTEHVPTVFANYPKDIYVCGEPVKLWLCDTAGQEEFDRLRVMSYHDTRVFLLCFSVTDPESLHSITEKWLPEARFYCPSAQHLLVATKVDLRFNEQEISRLAKDSLKPVSEELGEGTAAQLGCDGYQECSALTQDGLTQVFEMAARLALAPRNPTNCKSSKHKQSLKCCTS